MYNHILRETHLVFGFPMGEVGVPPRALRVADSDPQVGRWERHYDSVHRRGLSTL